MKQITSSTTTSSVFAALLAASNAKNPIVGDVIDGEIVGTTRGGYFVSIGTKSDAFMPHDECAEPTVGAKARFVVIACTEKDEEFTVSQKRVEGTERRNETLSKLAALRGTTGTVTATIKKVVSPRHSDSVSGFEAYVNGIKCFIPRHEMVYHGKAQSVLGLEVPVCVQKFEQNEPGCKANVVLSHAVALRSEQRNFLETLDPKAVLHATVIHVLDNNKGALVKVGPVTGLVPREGLVQNGHARVQDSVAVGQELKLNVIKVDAGKLKLHLSRLTASIDDMQVGEIRTGKVTSVADFGVFVSFDNGLDGLVHNTELGDVNKRALQLGVAVQARVKALDAARMRVSLSLKGVAQA